MSLVIRVEADKSAEALQDLLDTFLDDDVLRMHARPQPVNAEPEPGRLSLGLIGAIEMFIAVADAAELCRHVARAIKRWRTRDEQAASVSVTLELGGKKIVLPAGEIDTVKAAVAILGLVTESAAAVAKKPADDDDAAS